MIIYSKTNDFIMFDLQFLILFFTGHCKVNEGGS